MGAALAISGIRQPRPLLLIDDQPATGLAEMEVDATSYQSADRFRLRAALSAVDPRIWSEPGAVLTLQVLGDTGPVSLLTGTADNVSVDPIRGGLTMSGRDLASRFLVSQLDESFENQTSSEIVTLLANRQGLGANVMATQSQVGRYYQNSRTRIALNQRARATTQWDLLCWLAQIEGFEVWVSGQILNFQPSLSTPPVLTLHPSDCLGLQMHRALDIASGVTVIVKSWSSSAQTTISRTATSSSPGAPAITRTLIKPNLSSTDAESLANRTLQQIIQHERRLEIEMPGELTLTPRNIILFENTGTDFDGLYVVTSLSRRISFHQGFVQSVEARSLAWTTS